jgi:hypothetical protein
MSQPDCGVCNQFLAIVLSYYEALLDRHGFQFVECAGERGGRECTIMYTNGRANLLFERSDGADGTAIGAASLPFPRDGWTGVDGQGGWYSVIGLLEYVRGKKKLLTPKLMDDFVRGTRAYLGWEADTVAGQLEELIALFDPARPRGWIEDFAAYSKTRRYA